MAEPLPNDPHEPEDETAAPPQPPAARAPWWLGADEGLTDERETAREPRPVPRLVRPGEGTDAPTVEASAPRATTPPRWAPPAPSVPALPRTPPAPMVVGPSDRAREFPMDDAEERAIVKQRLESEAAEQAVRAHEVVSPEEFDAAGPAAPPWRQLLDTRATNPDQRRVLVLAALAVVLALAWGVSMAWDTRTTPIGRLVRDPHQWADREVTVHGRVVEVFPVGASWAFTLVQGRDTVVVFTRSREPRPRQRLTVQGVVSTGTLDGQQHVAVFEATD